MPNGAFFLCLGAKTVDGNHAHYNGGKCYFDVPSAPDLWFVRRKFGEALTGAWRLCLGVYTHAPFRAIIFIFHFFSRELFSKLPLRAFWERFILYILYCF
jgi:hypothetical protein